MSLTIYILYYLIYHSIYWITLADIRMFTRRYIKLNSDLKKLINDSIASLDEQSRQQQRSTGKGHVKDEPVFFSDESSLGDSSLNQVTFIGDPRVWVCGNCYRSLVVSFMNNAIYYIYLFINPDNMVKIKMNNFYLSTHI